MFLDALFLYAVTSQWQNSKSKYDGGVESTIRKYSLLFSYLSLFFRVSFIKN